MIMYRITNITPMNIVIEDIGIRLQPSGGESSHAIVRSDIAQRSSDLNRYSGWVKIEKFEIVQNEVIKTNNDIKSNDIKTPVELDKHETKKDNDEKSVSKDDFEKLVKFMESINIKQDEFFDKLSRLMNSNQTSNTSNYDEKGIKEVPKMDDIIIIPGGIIPKFVEISVNAKENEMEVNDFDDALKALKKAKK